MYILHRVEGLIVQVDPTPRLILDPLRPIEHYMAPMTMPFHVAAGKTSQSSSPARASSTPWGHHDVMIIMMRTTVNLPDDVYRVARDVAHTRNVSLGDALAELVRQGLRPADRLDFSGQFPKFKVPPDAKTITLEQTLAAEDEL